MCGSRGKPSLTVFGLDDFEISTREQISEDLAVIFVILDNQDAPAHRIRPPRETDYTHQTVLRYSITSSALASSMSGIVRPIAFAVLLFMTNSNLFGC